MNQLYGQYFGHTIGHIGFITNNMTSFLSAVGYGLLPERKFQSESFSEVIVDQIGPWKINVQCRAYELNALSAIAPVTNLVELTRINQKTSKQITRKFAQYWLSRYHSPEPCIHDNEGEFTGWEFQ